MSTILMNCSDGNEVNSPSNFPLSVTVDEDGYAMIVTNDSGISTIKTSNFGDLQFYILNDNNENLADIEIILIESDTSTYINISDSKNNYASYMFCGNPYNMDQNILPKDGNSSVINIVNEGSEMKINVKLGPVRSNLWQQHEASRAFHEVSEFHISDLKMSHDISYKVQSLNEIGEFLYRDLKLRFSSAVFVLDAIVYGSEDPIDIFIQGMNFRGTKAYRYSWEQTRNFFEDWINQQKGEWGGIDTDSNFIVRYFPFYEVETQQRVLGFDLKYIGDNKPPRPQYWVWPPVGFTSTSFKYDATKTSDSEDDISLLLARWDWENDGIWDTDFSYEKIVYHKYSEPGTYNVNLEIMDTEGLRTQTKYGDITVF